jgi:hypothetical protein
VTAAAGIRALLVPCRSEAPRPVLTGGAACSTFRSTMSRNGTSCCAKRGFAMASNRALAVAAARLSSHPSNWPFQVRSLLSPKGVASDCPLLRASDEGLLRPRVPRAKRTLEVTPSSPLLMGNSLQSLAIATLCPTMQQTNAYHRSLYRLPVTYPAMYCGMSTIGEGTITNLSAMGCTIETDQPLPTDQDVALCLLLPDQHESLPIELAHVRWANGKQAGIEFVLVEHTANLRLYSFVSDQMVQRAHTVQQHRATS